MNQFKFTYIYETKQEPLKICRCCDRVLQPIPTTKKSCSARCRMRGTYKRRHPKVLRTEELKMYNEWKKLNNRSIEDKKTNDELYFGRVKSKDELRLDKIKKGYY